MEVIAPGHHLYAGPDGTWRSCDDRERFARVSGPDDLLERMREHAYKGTSEAEVEPLAALLRERGVLAEPVVSEPADVSVRVTGDGPVAAAVIGLLGTCGGVGLVEDPGAADVVVACEGWLPDARWQVLDERGVIWHRCHVEGTRLVLGPMTVPGSTVSYRDLRGRRLAAAGIPGELAAHWAYLDAGAAGEVPLPAVPWPNPGVVAIAAGLLVNDLLAWRDTGLPAARNLQLVLDPGTGALTRHPVLPLPVA